MSCVFQNIDTPPPSPPGECVLPPGGEGGGVSIFWKPQDTALYSTYIESSLGGVVYLCTVAKQWDYLKEFLTKRYGFGIVVTFQPSLYFSFEGDAWFMYVL
jgi:hypothetical protein